MIRSIDDLAIESKRVFVRADLNVPLDNGNIADDTRIRAVLPTLKTCIARGARVVIGSHLGRPKGEPNKSLSLEPVASYLAQVLDQSVSLTDEPIGDGARKVIADLREGQVAILENLRFHPGETSNEETFAKTLASYADVYINDAFGTAHRAHASTVGMVHHVAEFGAGYVMKKEIDMLSKLLGEVDKPYLAVIGGAKVTGKIDVLEALLKRVNVILLGGAMANTFLRANGYNLGSSRFEQDKLAIARTFLRKAADAGVTVRLPTDVVVAESIDATRGMAQPVAEVSGPNMAFDIGPETQRLYKAEVEKARTLFWNGPMGVFEREPFAQGTLAIANAVAESTRCFRVVGGGDSAAAAVKAGIADRIDHISTGGGASLEFIQGIKLPGIQALEQPQ